MNKIVVGGITLAVVSAGTATTVHFRDSIFGTKESNNPKPPSEENRGDAEAEDRTQQQPITASGSEVS